LRIICIIPSFNEENAIKKIINGASQYCDRIIVVNDGSQDKTDREAKNAGATVANHLINLGTGAALSTGLQIAKREEADIVVTMDGDGQHDPNDIPILLRPLKEEKVDVVLGSRFLGNIKGMPFHKKIGNRFLSIITSIRCGQKVTDSQCGFRAYSKKVFKSIIPDSADYTWASESLVRVVSSDYKWIEVPIKTIYPKKRIKGTGLIDGIKIFIKMILYKN
jgi:glycosyltransferase involved in cell wall biosynthesis